jgi:hypothetical protein
MALKSEKHHHDYTKLSEKFNPWKLRTTKVVLKNLNRLKSDERKVLEIF